MPGGRGTIDAVTEPWIRDGLVVLDAAARRGLHHPVDPPDHWTPARAEAVVEVLYRLLDAVCSKYADALLQTGRKDLLVEAQWPGSGGDDLRRPRSLDRARSGWRWDPATDAVPTRMSGNSGGMRLGRVRGIRQRRKVGEVPHRRRPDSPRPARR